ncbi:hypothetical protein FHS96_005489 [Sphingomonas zeicaulis]|uniref:DUF3616 domain-containing protein n=1 Tax=Sphingomonas zeicaulis TaxID=1632740 RepID=UPI003D23FDF2
MQTFMNGAIAVVLSASFQGISPCHAESPPPVAVIGAQWEVTKDLKFKVDNSIPEYNVSGMACSLSDKSSRICVIIDDELTFAERVNVRGRKIEPDAPIELVTASTPVGTAPVIPCDDVKKPNDLDGEAVAESEGSFYVIGSHGCGRNKGAFRSSSFLLARIPLVGTPAVTYRVSEALQGCPDIGGRYGKWLQDFTGKDGKPRADDNGLNIEGLAITGGRMWIGLRGPVLRREGSPSDEAFIISLDADAPFIVDKPLQARLYSVGLGPERGVRDLAALGDGRILILAGPRIGGGIDYAIYVFDPRNGTAVAIATLRQHDPAQKQEGLVVLREDRNTVDLLLLQDGVKNGGPYEVQVNVPPRGPAVPAGERQCKAGSTPGRM